MNNSGVHGTLPLRGADLRITSYKQAKIIEEIINRRWQYDPNRPKYKVCIVHGSPVHIHLQVHPNTRRDQ